MSPTAVSPRSRVRRPVSRRCSQRLCPLRARSAQIELAYSSFRGGRHARVGHRVTPDVKHLDLREGGEACHPESVIAPLVMVRSLRLGSAARHRRAASLMWAPFTIWSDPSRASPRMCPGLEPGRWQAGGLGEGMAAPDPHPLDVRGVSSPAAAFAMPAVALPGQSWHVCPPLPRRSAISRRLCATAPSTIPREHAD